MSHRTNFRNLEKPQSTFYIYAIYFPNEPNPKYIGKGSGYRYKNYTHIMGVKNKEFRQALHDLFESGEEYEISFLFESDDEIEVLEAEEFYIAYYGRLYNETGILYNLSPGNYKITNTGENRKRPVYHKGFVFDSVSTANEVVSCSVKNIKYGETQLTSCYLDNPVMVKAVSEKERKDREYLKYGYFFKTKKKSFKKAMKHYRNKHETLLRGSIKKPIEIDGVLYESHKEASECFGWKKSSSFVRWLKKGNHNHTFKMLKGRRSGKAKIKINDTIYKDREHAAEDMGYKHTQSLMYHLKRNPDKYKVTFPYIEE